METRYLERKEEFIFTMEMKIILFCLSIISLLIMFPNLLFATNSDLHLTDIFQMNAFRGSFEIIQGFNLFGYVVNFIISIFSFLGLALQAIQIMATLLYLSMRSMFDKIHEIKKSHSGSQAGIFALKGIFNDIKENKYGSGFDTIGYAILGMLPDIKEVSHFSDNGKFKDEEISTFILKISLPTILSMFFFSMGFNGTLWQTWAMCSDALGEVAYKFCDSQLPKKVYSLLNIEDAFTFSLDADGTEYGKLRQNIAEDIYSKVLQQVEPGNTDTGNYTSTQMQLIGQAINSFMEGYVTPDNIVKSCGASTGANTFTATDNVMTKSGSSELTNIGDSSWALRVSDLADKNFKNVEYSVTVDYYTKRYSYYDTVIYLGGAPADGVSNACTNLANGVQIQSDSTGITPVVHVIIKKKSSAIDDNYLSTTTMDETTNKNSNKNINVQEK